MHGNKKLSLIVSVLILLFSVIIIVIVTINFKNISQQKERVKAIAIASLVRDGLTAHMVNGVMDKRKLFLDQVKESSGASKLWVFRTQNVINEYGKGLYEEQIKDKIDKQVSKSGKNIYLLNSKSFLKPTLRITIPYIATKNGQINCLSCHIKAKDGDVLGGISMVFDLSDTFKSDIIVIFKIALATIIFILIFILISNKMLKPYEDLLNSIKLSLKKANYGNYSSRIEIKDDNKISEIAKWLNNLLEKLEQTIASIDKNIALFVSDRRQNFQSPLDKSKVIIEELADIYRFKKTIEQDISKDIIYERIIKIFKEKLNISDLSFYEVDKKYDSRKLIYDDTPEKFCDIANTKTSIRCRAYRTNSIVLSDNFEEVCKACVSNKEYLCINYPIDENISLVVNIKPKNKDELLQTKKMIGYIRNYLDSARPVLQSKNLTEILRLSSMIDGLTGLYNRNYLDEFMKKEIKKYKNYAIAMIDIDHFKNVNDTFGHNAGDIVLKKLSSIFKEELKDGALAFRFGGEEFLIFAPNFEGLDAMIKKISSSFSKYVFEFDGKKVKKTFSAGIDKNSTDVDPWQVVKNADIALYKAKESGRNKIIFFVDVKK